MKSLLLLPDPDPLAVMNSLWFLDAAGKGTASFNVPPALVGWPTQLHHAVVTLDTNLASTSSPSRWRSSCTDRRLPRQVRSWVIAARSVRVESGDRQWKRGGL